MSDRIIIKNGIVVTMNDADDVIFGGTVVIDDDRITDVGRRPRSPRRVDSSDATVIDATDKAVLPGLVDLHYHTAIGKGWSDHLPLWEYLETCWYPIIRALSPEEAYWAALASYSESIKCGVTTVNDMYRRLDGLARAAEEIGIRAVLSNDVADDEHDLDTLEDNKAAFEQSHGRADGRIEVLHRDRVAAARVRGPAQGGPRAGRRPGDRYPYPSERVADRGRELEGAVRAPADRGRLRLRDPVRPMHRRALRVALGHGDRADARDGNADLAQSVVERQARQRHRARARDAGGRSERRAWGTTRRSATTAVTCSRS